MRSPRLERVLHGRGRSAANQEEGYSRRRSRNCTGLSRAGGEALAGMGIAASLGGVGKVSGGKYASRLGSSAAGRRTVVYWRSRSVDMPKRFEAQSGHEVLAQWPLCSAAPWSAAAWCAWACDVDCVFAADVGALAWTGPQTQTMPAKISQAQRKVESGFRRRFIKNTLHPYPVLINDL